MADSDSEYEVEETVVLVELNGIIDSNFLLQNQEFARILGVETEKPVLQIGSYVFTGEYEDTLGSVIAYEPCASKDDGSKQDFKFLCKTDKKLSMKRVFVQEKEKEPLKTEDTPVDIAVNVNGTPPEETIQDESNENSTSSNKENLPASSEDSEKSDSKAVVQIPKSLPSPSKAKSKKRKLDEDHSPEKKDTKIIKQETQSSKVIHISTKDSSSAPVQAISSSSGTSTITSELAQGSAILSDVPNDTLLQEQGNSTSIGQILSTEARSLVESSTDNLSQPISSDESKNNDSCSSSIDLRLPLLSEGTDNNNASSSSQIIVQDVSDSGETFDSTSDANIPCEVSQSESNISERIHESPNESSECEVFQLQTSPIRPLQTSAPSGSEDSSTSRKLSSCEVTQSNNEPGQCDVFSRTSPTNESIESSGNIIDQSDLYNVARQSLNSEGSTSEVSQSHKSVRHDSESIAQKEYEDSLAGGEVCSQSSDKSAELPLPLDRQLELDEAQNSCEVSQSNSSQARKTGNQDVREADNENTVREDSVSSYGALGAREPRTDEENNTDPSCEVSQSRSHSNRETESEVQEGSPSGNEEVSQSVKPSDDNSSHVDDENNECEGGAETFELGQSSLSEVCESSDDISAAGVSNEGLDLTVGRGTQAQNLSCEVSQSYRLEDVNAEFGSQEYIDIAVETSNECDVIEIEIYNPNDDNNAGGVDYSVEAENNEAQNLSQVTQSLPPPNAVASRFSDPICESSEDVRTSGPFVVRSDSDASSSSDKPSISVQSSATNLSVQDGNNRISQSLSSDSRSIVVSSSGDVNNQNVISHSNASNAATSSVESIQSSIMQSDVQSSSMSVPQDLSRPRVASNLLADQSQRTVGSRPSLLEVMVSSASDFRNSLYSAGQSTYTLDSGPDPSLNEAAGYPCEENSDNSVSVVDIEQHSAEGQESQVSGSLETDAVPSAEAISNNQNVSQSSDVVNTSSSRTQAALSENTTESARHELVQSSSNVSRSANPALSVDDLVEEDIVIQGHSGTRNVEVSESFNPNLSISTSLESRQNDSTHGLENVEGVVSSTPSAGNYEMLSLDGSSQSFLIEGNVLLSDNNRVMMGSDVFEDIEGTNEAETLNAASAPPSPPLQIPDLPDHIPASSDDVAPAFEIDVESDDSFASESYVVVDEEIYEIQDEIASHDSSSHVSGSDANSGEAESSGLPGVLSYEETNNDLTSSIDNQAGPSHVSSYANDGDLTSSVDNEAFIDVEYDDSANYYAMPLPQEDSSELEVWEAQNSNLVDSSDDQSDRNRYDDSPEVESSTKESEPKTDSS